MYGTHHSSYSWAYALEFMLGLGIRMGMQWPGVGGSPSLRVALSALALPQRYRLDGIFVAVLPFFIALDRLADEVRVKPIHVVYVLNSSILQLYISDARR